MTVSTKNVRTRYAIELYPFDSNTPGLSDFLTPTSSKIGVITGGSSKSFTSLISKAIGVGDSGDDAPEFVTSTGLTRIAIRRSKDTPDAQCSFEITGPAPETATVGTWVLITSISDKIGKKGQAFEERLVRFIGQIYDISSDYIATSTGLKQSKTLYSVREWSAALTMPVRYDIFSIVRSLPENQSVTGAATAAFGFGGALSVDDLQKIVLQSYNPYELAHIVLQLVGALNQTDRISDVGKGVGLKLPEVALQMPSIPPILLSRLGLTGVAPDNAFNSGLLDVITGIQKSGVYSDGKWKGVFGAGANIAGQSTGSAVAAISSQAGSFSASLDSFSKTLNLSANPTVKEYKNSFEKNPSDRPLCLGLGALMSTGESAWAILQKYCDPSFNEIFTDILYSQGAGEDDIVATPVIFIRDKPFLMKKVVTDLGIDDKNWTKYDDLPRVRIATELIQSFKLNNTFINSPNFIRPEFAPVQPVKGEDLKVFSQIKGTLKLDAEMHRFGGIEHYPKTNFLSQGILKSDQGDFDINKWILQLRDIASAWDSFNYKTGGGSISIIDDNVPISVGLNVQFTIGIFELVGHVDSVDMNFTIDSDGTQTVQTRVSLSRIVQDLGGKLDYIAPEAFGNILRAIPAKSPALSSSISTDQILGGLKSFASKLV